MPLKARGGRAAAPENDIRVMVQKSQGVHHRLDVEKHVINNGIDYQPQLVNTGFLVAINSTAVFFLNRRAL